MSLKEDILECDVLKKAEAKVVSLGVGDIVAPKNIKPLPDDVTNLISEELGSFLTQYDAEIAYVRSLVSKAEVQVRYGKYAIERAKKSLFKGMRGKNLSVPDSKNEVDLDEGIMEAEGVLISLEAEKLMLESRLDAFTQYRALVSREISRRRDENNSKPFGGGGSGNEGSQEKTESRVDRIRGESLIPQLPPAAAKKKGVK